MNLERPVAGVEQLGEAGPGDVIRYAVTPRFAGSAQSESASSSAAGPAGPLLRAQINLVVLIIIVQT